MYPENDYRDYLEHHGILGMKWGVRRSDTYPLKPSEHSASEKKAGWKKSLGGGGKKTKSAGNDSKPKEKDVLYNIYKMNAAAYDKLGQKKMAGVQRAAANARLRQLENKKKEKAQSQSKTSNEAEPKKESKPKEKDILYNIYKMNAATYDKLGQKKMADIQRFAANDRLRELEKKAKNRKIG